MQSIVWWSGPSAVNLVDVMPYCVYEEYGCNFFQELRSIDHAVCYDLPVMDLIEQTPSVTYWCRPKAARPNWRPVPHPYQHCHVSDSGTLAVELALARNPEHCWIIGCDWGNTNVSIQDHHYAFRGYQPPKYTNIKDKWLSELDHTRVTWVHLQRQPWMTSFIHQRDFLDFSTSLRH